MFSFLLNLPKKDSGDYIIPKYPKIFRRIQKLQDRGCRRVNGNITGCAELLHGGDEDHRDILTFALLCNGIRQSRVRILGQVDRFDPACCERLAQLLDADHPAGGLEFVKL